MKILSGKIVRDGIMESLKEEIGGFSGTPYLAIIQVGDFAESNAYINQKKKFAESVGVKVEHIRFTGTIGEMEIIKKIVELNDDENINGILVQLPLPKHLNKENIIE